MKSPDTADGERVLKRAKASLKYVKERFAGFDAEKIKPYFDDIEDALHSPAQLTGRMITSMTDYHYTIYHKALKENDTMTARKILEEVLTKFGHLSQDIADYCNAEVAKLEGEDTAVTTATEAPASEAPATEAAPAAPEAEAAPATTETSAS